MIMTTTTMEGEVMTDLQWNGMIKMIMTIIEKCQDKDEALEALANLLKTSKDNTDNTDNQ